MGLKKSKNVKRKNKSSKKKTIFFTMLSLCLIVTITYVFSLNFLEIYQIYNEKKELTQKMAKLDDEEEKLSGEVERLQDPEYIARYAREKYLYSKDGEFIIKMP